MDGVFHFKSWFLNALGLLHSGAYYRNFTAHILYGYLEQSVSINRWLFSLQNHTYFHCIKCFWREFGFAEKISESFITISKHGGSRDACPGKYRISGLFL